ncbi:MAG: hypothetical protein RLO52_11110 [Sandaracinaceae bacterium]
MRKRLAVSVSLLTVLAGALVAAVAAADASRSKQAAAGQTQVELVEAGEGDRQPLRYRFEAGQRTRLRFTLEMDMQASMGERSSDVDMPAARLDLDLGPTAVTDGHLRYPWRVSGLDVVGGAEGPAREQFEQGFSGLEGAHGVAEIDDRGRVIDLTFELPEGAAPELRQHAQTLRDGLGQLTPPLPEEAVGTGAVWRIGTQLRMQGMSLSMSSEYRLRRRAGDRLELQTRVRNADGSQLPPGAQLDVTGSGRTRLELDRLGARSRARTVTEILNRGAQGEMRMRLEQRTELAPRS